MQLEQIDAKNTPISSSDLIALMTEVLELINQRLPPAISKPFNTVKAFSTSPPSVTTLKKIRDQCNQWVLEQYRGRGYEVGEMFAMEAVLSLVEEYRQTSTKPWTQRLIPFLIKIAEVDSSLEDRIVALVQKHLVEILKGDADSE